MEIKTVGELIKALGNYSPDLEVRTVFDAGGNWHFPHPCLNLSESEVGDCLLIEHELLKY